VAEIIVKAVDSTSPNPLSSKRGHLIAVRPDGWQWGSGEGLPNFVFVKIPGISVDTVRKYIQAWFDNSNPDEPVVKSKYLWQLLIDTMPQAAIKKFKNQGEVVISAGGYNGPSDYTWTQVKVYFRNLQTGLTETEDL
jgi:hypothetical protein